MTFKLLESLILQKQDTERKIIAYRVHQIRQTIVLLKNKLSVPTKKLVDKMEKHLLDVYYPYDAFCDLLDQLEAQFDIVI